MEELAETERAAPPPPPPAAAPERKPVRRKLVQSMLFPHSNGKLAEKLNTENEEEEEEEGEEEEEEEEWRGSQGGGGCRGMKRKQNQARNSKPRASQKVKSNGKDTLNKKGGDRDSADIAKSDFFLKVSERLHQKREQKEQVYLVPDGVDDSVASIPVAAGDMKISPQTNSAPKKQRMNATPKKKARSSDLKEDMKTSPQANSTTKKQQMNSTPKRKAMSSGSKGAYSRQTSSDLTQGEPMLQATPNLRLEAKLTAEENSRMYAGRQIHPFFSSRKVDKKSQEIIDLEMEQYSSQREREGIAFNPVHVFERVEDEAHTLDWGHWTFEDTIFVYSSCGRQNGGPTLYEGSVSSLLLNNFPSLSRSTRTSLCQNEISAELSLQAEAPVIHLCERGTNTVNYGHDNSSFTTHNAEGQGTFCQGSCENCLWTDKYHPKNAMQVCGNGEAVKCLSEWLHCWHEKCSQTSRSVKSDDKSIAEDDLFYNQSDCDSDDMIEETALENVLLVTGPVGSGKSAAIYACAKEQGFQVIEINASDWRNGALVKQKFGEAVESHWLQGTTTSKRKHLPKSIPVVASNGSDNDVIDLISLSEGEDFEFASAGLRPVNDQNKIKTLILFEDVDATLHEDSGFISTIQQLAKTAKRPMILTSNSENPLLPSNLHRLHLCFTVPSLKELSALANAVCAAESAGICSSMVEHFVDLCQRDIRKTIMNLQFWCQGQTFGGNEWQTTYGPFPFDLDASHWVLPKIIPWSYPSPLSELVEVEITKSLMMMEEHNKQVEIVMEEELNDSNLEDGLSTPNKLDYIDAKKKALLSLHCSAEDDDGLAAPLDTIYDFYCSPDSPVAGTQPGFCRKFNAVVFSDSEEDYFTDKKTVVSRRMIYDTDDETHDVNITAPSTNLLGEMWCSPTTELLNQFEAKLEEKFCERAGTTDCSPITDENQHAGSIDCLHINDGNSADRFLVHRSNKNDTYISVEVSCVPESSIVPETEFDTQTDLSSRTVSHGHASCKAAIDSMGIDPLTDLVPTGGEKHDKLLPALDGTQEILGNSCHFSRGAVNREVVGDSQFDSLVDVPIGYQVLDECSRVDLIRRFKCSDNLISHQQIDFVQDMWRKLRDCKIDFRHYVTPQEKDAIQVMEVTYGLSNLVSDADLLLRDCQPLLSDSLDQVMIPCDKSLSYSWHDDQLHMSSIFAEHGICFYAKEAAAVGSRVGLTNGINLALEMLASSTNTMAMGKLVSWERKQIDNSEMRLPGSSVPLKSKMNLRLVNVLQCVVPSKSFLSLQGDTCYEYLSSLSQISRIEASPLSEGVDKRKQRRYRLILSTRSMGVLAKAINFVPNYHDISSQDCATTYRTRVARHYLSSGAFALAPEDISFLGEYNYYRKVSSQPSAANLR